MDATSATFRRLAFQNLPSPGSRGEQESRVPLSLKLDCMAPHHSFPFIQEMPPAAASPAPPRPPGSPRVEHHRAPGRSICGAARYSEKTCRAMERHGGRPPAAPLARATRRTRRQWCLVPAQAAAADASLACSQVLFQSGVLFVASLAGSPLPLHTSTRGWTVPQLPSGVDGISFTVPPLGSRSRAPSVPHPTDRTHPIQTSAK